MSDLVQTFSVLESVKVPDQWDEIIARVSDPVARPAQQPSRRRAVLLFAAVVAAAVVAVMIGLERDDDSGGEVVASDGGDPVAVGFDELYATAPRMGVDDRRIDQPDPASLPEGWDLELVRLEGQFLGSESVLREYGLRDGDAEASLILVAGLDSMGSGESVDLTSGGFDRTGTMMFTPTATFIGWNLVEDSAVLSSATGSTDTLIELASSLRFAPGPLTGSARPASIGLPDFETELMAGVVDGLSWRLLTDDDQVRYVVELDGTAPIGWFWPEDLIDNYAGNAHAQMLSKDGTQVVLVAFAEPFDTVAVAHPDGTRTEHSAITTANGRLSIAVVPIPAGITAPAIEASNSTTIHRALLRLARPPEAGWMQSFDGSQRFEWPEGDEYIRVAPEPIRP